MREIDLAIYMAYIYAIFNESIPFMRYLVDNP